VGGSLEGGPVGGGSVGRGGSDVAGGVTVITGVTVTVTLGRGDGTGVGTDTGTGAGGCVVQSGGVREDRVGVDSGLKTAWV